MAAMQRSAYEKKLEWAVYDLEIKLRNEKIKRIEEWIILETKMNDLKKKCIALKEENLSLKVLNSGLEEDCARYIKERKSCKTKMNKLGEERNEAIGRLEVYEDLVPKIERKMQEVARAQHNNQAHSSCGSRAVDASNTRHNPQQDFSSDDDDDSVIIVSDNFDTTSGFSGNVQESSSSTIGQRYLNEDFEPLYFTFRY